MESKDRMLKKQGEDKEQSIRSLKEGSLMSKRMNTNMQNEMRIMSGVFHNMGYEMFTR